MFTVTYNFSSSARARRRLRAARLALCLGTLACILLSQFAAFAQACAGVRKDTLRLHILANSDSPQDQALKLAVRDAILEEYGNLFEQQATQQEAKAVAQAHLSDMEQTAARVLAEAGCPQPVHAHVVNMMFHTKEYDGFTLPAGRYDAVRIELGQAAGHNWFCVLFPVRARRSGCGRRPCLPTGRASGCAHPIQSEICRPGMVANPVGRGISRAAICRKLHILLWLPAKIVAKMPKGTLVLKICQPPPCTPRLFILEYEKTGRLCSGTRPRAGPHDKEDV